MVGRPYLAPPQATINGCVQMKYGRTRGIWRGGKTERKVRRGEAQQAGKPTPAFPPQKSSLSVLLQALTPRVSARSGFHGATGGGKERGGPFKKKAALVDRDLCLGGRNVFSKEEEKVRERELKGRRSRAGSDLPRTAQQAAARNPTNCHQEEGELKNLSKHPKCFRSNGSSCSRWKKKSRGVN